MRICLLPLVVLIGIEITNVKAEYTEYPVRNHSSGCKLDLNSDLPGIFASCSTYTPAETPFLLPLNTTRLKIYWVYDLPIDQPLAPNLEYLLVLELADNRLQNVSSTMLEGFDRLTHLGLNTNYITKLSVDLFDNTPRLEEIDLSNNYLVFLGNVAESLKKLKFLTKLNLSQNRLIRWISDRDFEPLSNLPLEFLDLSETTIERIESFAFKWLNNLTNLSVSKNTFLPDEALKNMTKSVNKSNLKSFSANTMRNGWYLVSDTLPWLSESGIESLDISKNRFPYFKWLRFPELKYLNLEKCGIRAQSYEIISGVPKLETLIMTHHRTFSIDKQFKEMVNLKHLDLRDYANDRFHHSVSIANYAFENLNALEFLCLNSLPIRDGIRSHTFHGLLSLKTLYLVRCSMLQVRDRAFETLGSLERLDLSHNILLELSNDTFLGLASLTYLNLAYNMLSFMNTSYPFEHTPKLEYLNVDGNKILQLHDGFVFDLKFLQVLSAENNVIRPWETHLVPPESNLTILWLPSNRITHFTEAMFDDIRYVSAFDFAHNPINCSHCNSKLLQEWMNSTNVTLMGPSVHTEAYGCQEPANLAKVPVSEADLAFLEDYCIPRDRDEMRILYYVLSPLLVMASAMLVWHQWKWNIKYMMFRVRSRVRAYQGAVDSRRYTFDAFVSHCDKDLPWVKDQLLTALESDSNPFTCCVPDRDFVAGCSFGDGIAAAIERSRTTLVVLSNEYMNSNWCRFEADVAQLKLFEDTRSGLILVLLEPIQKSKMAKNLRYIVRTRTCIEWTSNPVGQRLFWERLRSAILQPNDRGLSAHIT